MFSYPQQTRIVSDRQKDLLCMQTYIYIYIPQFCNSFFFSKHTFFPLPLKKRGNKEIEISKKVWKYAETQRKTTTKAVVYTTRTRNQACVQYVFHLLRFCLSCQGVVNPRTRRKIKARFICSRRRVFVVIYGSKCHWYWSSFVCVSVLLSSGNPWSLQV